MDVLWLLLTTLFVAPPVPPEPDPEPGMGRDAYGDALPFGAVGRYGTLRYRAGFAGGVAFSRDGKTIISAGSGNKLHFWETDTGELVREYKAFTAFNHQFAVSPDGKRVVTGNYFEKDVFVRDLQTGKVVRRLNGLKVPPNAIRYSPDGKLVAASEFQTDKVVVWEERTGRVVARLDMRQLGQPPQSTAYTISFSPNGKYFAIGDRELLVFEVEGWKHVATFEGHSDHIHSIAFTADASKIVTGAADWTLRVWDFATRKEIRRVSKEINGSIAVTRDGKTVIGVEKARLTAWSLETGKKLFCSETEAFAHGLVLSEDETRVAGWNSSAVLVYDARTGRCLTPVTFPDYPPRLLAFSPNSKFLVMACGGVQSREVRLWGFQSGLEFRQRRMGFESAWAVRVTKDREVFVCASSPETGVGLWNLTTGERIAALPKGIWASGAVFAENRRVYTAGTELIEWNISDRRIDRRIALPPDLAHPQLLLSADGRVLLTLHPGNGVAKSWSAITGRELSSMAIHKSDRAVAISADGKRFATADRSACLRDMRNGDIVHDLGGKKSSAVAFSPDGRLIAVADALGAIQFWDAKTMKELRRLEGHGEFVRDLLFSPDSRYLASVSLDTTILVWDVRKLAPGGK